MVRCNDTAFQAALQNESTTAGEDNEAEADVEGTADSEPRCRTEKWSIWRPSK